ncbi:meiosis-specific nuclear structural protein 1 [Suncus etruscus]|uniref:meiosis-specific nuclear structural protein 1 n=1 Tax=Suncus etruscus TaxID=109475 RepID=UPI00210F6685|nr:meiosis-specific nuclear structural protein 1 [Suncus etruscus]
MGCVGNSLKRASPLYKHQRITMCISWIILDNLFPGSMENPGKPFPGTLKLAVLQSPKKLKADWTMPGPVGGRACARRGLASRCPGNRVNTPRSTQSGGCCCFARGAPGAEASNRRTLSHSERYEKLLDRNYKKQLEIEQLKRIQNQANIQRVQNKSAEFVEQKRFLRLLKNEQLELDMEEAIQKAEENKRLKELQLEQEEKLAAELARLKHESIKDEKMRQQIRENSIELRELEKKLKAAYMNKERAAQIAERDAIKYEQMKRDAEIARNMMEEHERLTKEENAAEDKKNQVKAQYCLDLEKQLEEQELKKQEAYKQLLKEKLMIDEIVRKIYEEDQLERQQRLEKMNVTRQYIEEFKKQQNLWRKKKREEMEDENRRIIEFAHMQQQREEDRMSKAQENEEKRQQLQNMLAQKLEEKMRQREDLEHIRQELYLEEQAADNKRKLKEEAEKKLRKQKELKQDFIEQMALKELVLQAAKEEEEIFRKAMLAKFAEDDRIELMNAQKQRMKQLEHRRAVEKLIEERRNQFLADKQHEIEEWQLQQRRQGCINEIIEEERRKLLKEHAAKLIGYLPKGVFKKEDEINILGEEFRKAYQKRSEIAEEK